MLLRLWNTCETCKNGWKRSLFHIPNKLFSIFQYGFIERRSTTLQLLYVLHEWTEILGSGGTIDVVYIDFMKAFDKVSHARLQKKLESYGIGGNLLKWISSFPTGRRQRVHVGSATSEWSAVASGIPPREIRKQAYESPCHGGTQEAEERSSPVEEWNSRKGLYMWWSHQEKGQPGIPGQVFKKGQTNCRHLDQWF